MTRRKAVPKVLDRTEKMINIKAPAYVKEQIDDWARDDPSQTVRGLILRALKTYGLHIEDDDLKDRRRKDD